MSLLRLTSLAVFASMFGFIDVSAAQDGSAPHKPSEGPATFVPNDSDSASLSSPPAADTASPEPVADDATAVLETDPTTEAASHEDTTDSAKIKASSVSTPVSAASAPTPQATPKLLSAAKEARLKKLLPKVDDPKIAAVLEDPRTIFYTDEEMPKAYQFYNGAFPGLHSVNYNISANGREPFGNGNREFPWSTPAGAHRCDNVYTFRFLYLPVDKEGKTLPIVYHPSSQGGQAWTYPVGTVFGEVLVELGPDRVGYPFELRTRTRVHADWDSDAFRPFPTARDLADRLREVEPEWQSKKNVAALISHLEKPIALKTSTLADSQPQKQTFRATMGVDTLPSLGDDKLVAKLLKTTTFTSAKEKYWRVSTKSKSLAEVAAVAPTTLASFHIVPKNYDAGFIEVDQQSCMRCHETTNEDVNNFDAGRDWYGRVRGSDGAFSFHPFEPSSMSYNGFSSSPTMRASFLRGGIVERFSKASHPRTLYQRIRNLKY